jgi:hypothetical protein
VALIRARDCYAQEWRRKAHQETYVRGTRYRPEIGVAQAISRRSRGLATIAARLCLAAPERAVEG